MTARVKKGFTLIELLVILAVIAVLFVAYISKVDFATYKAKDSGILTDFRSYEIAIKTTTSESGEFKNFVTKDAYIESLHKNLDKSLKFTNTGGKYLSEAINQYGYKYELKFNEVDNQLEIYSPKAIDDGSGLFAYGAPDENGEELYVGKLAVYNYAVGKLTVTNFNTRLTLQTPSGTPVTPEPESKYKLATDADFSGTTDGTFKYIGTAEYVEIPHVIKGIPVTSYRSMFENTSVKGVKSTNTNVTQTIYMFRDSQATTLDLSNLDTSKVMNMSGMFQNSQATTLDLSSFNTFTVISMSNMFMNSKATELDLSSFNMHTVTGLIDMFNGSQATTGYARTASDATKLNASPNKPSGLTFTVKINYKLATDEDFSGDTDGTFKYIGTAEYVEIPHTIKGVPVTSYKNMFKATNVNGVKSTNKNVTDMSSMFDSSTSASLDLSELDTSNVTNMYGMFWSSKATTLDLSKFNTNKVINMSWMFYGSKATTLDLNSFNTSAVTNMSSMFFSSKATTINLSSFNTSSVTNMSGMFDASEAISLNLSGFNTSNVTNMSAMFGASKVTTLDLSSFDTSNVTDMSRMFRMSNTITLNLSSFNTFKVTDMNNMFTGCQATVLDLSSFDTSNTTNISQMFRNSQATTGYARNQTEADKFNTLCEAPYGLTFISVEPIEYTMATDEDFSGTTNGSFKYIGSAEYVEIPHTIKGVTVTSYSFMFGSNATIKGVKSTNPNITNMSYMFAMSSSLSSIDLTQFDTSNVQNMTCMFDGCNSLTTLDLSSFDTLKVANMDDMFYCTALTTGYARTQADANRFNASQNKPAEVTFVVK